MTRADWRTLVALGAIGLALWSAIAVWGAAGDSHEPIDGPTTSTTAPR